MSSNHEYQELEDKLKEAIKGEVSFDNDYKALYATDSSNYRQIPIGVVFPKRQGRYPCNGAVGEPVRRAASYPWRRYQPGRSMLQFSYYHGLQ